MREQNDKSSAEHVLVIVSGSVLIRCSTCGQLVSEVFKMNGGTVRCPYCKSQYVYKTKLLATKEEGD